ncbi:sugar porter family MFS transporter [Actinophytocola sp.]|jgi:sugar porter (SP) family MFS transporter|uniref:sugar porter family MFS transporter n=1 Tax=Actinophytocola sp. TaxID=1872138 RepID=UPI002ED85706
MSVGEQSNSASVLGRPDGSAGPPVAGRRSVRRHVIAAAAVTALGGLLFGYDTGVVSGALLFLKNEFGGLSSLQQELVTSLLLIGAMIGAFGAGRVADRIGRRPTILITAVIFVVGVLLAALSPSFWTLIVARVVIGLAVGSASMTVPLYIGELAPPRMRGALVSLNQLAITGGILASYLVDYGLAASANWRLMFGLAVIPAALLFVGILTQAESPHWLIRQGREDEARRVLSRLRESDIDAEVAEVKEVAARRVSRRDLLARGVRPALWVGVLMAIFQQITGINTVIYYAPSLLAGAGLGNGASLLANVVNGVVNVGMTIVAIRLLDRTGRRPLLLAGTAGMVVGMVMTALAFFGGSQLHGATAYVAIAGLLIYTGSFAIGLGPVFWLMIAEIYPLRIRGQAMSVATIANWGANFVVTVSFLTMVDTITPKGSFFLFAVTSVVALVYFAKRVPETKQRSLQEIERDLGPATGDQRAPAAR